MYSLYLEGEKEMIMSEKEMQYVENLIKEHYREITRIEIEQLKLKIQIKKKQKELKNTIFVMNS